MLLKDKSENDDAIMAGNAMPCDKDLLAALKRREPEALEKVFERFSDRIYRLAISLLHDEQQADGVVQNTFLALIENIDRFEGRSHIGTWLYRVAYNECMGRLRRIRPDMSLDNLDDDAPMPNVFFDWQELPEEVLHSAEVREQIEQAVEALSPALRAVFMLRDVEELSTKETAEALGISEAAVKVRLHRARLALRERLAGYFEEYARL